MEILIISILIIAGLLLFATEVFLVPGITIAGIASAASMLYAIYYAFCSIGTTAGFITMGIVAIGITGTTIWFIKSKTVDRLALKKSLDYRTNPLRETEIHIGDTGLTITRLTLIGNAEINGHVLEVQSADGFIDEKTPVKVCRITESTIYVQVIK